MRTLLLATAVLAALVASALSAPSLSAEEERFLSAQLRQWLEEQAAAAAEQQPMAAFQRRSAGADEDPYASLILRRFSRGGAQAGKNYNNLGMHSLFRLDKRSSAPSKEY